VDEPKPLVDGALGRPASLPADSVGADADADVDADEKYALAAQLKSVRRQLAAAQATIEELSAAPATIATAAAATTGRVVQVDSIKTRVESAYDFIA